MMGAMPDGLVPPNGGERKGNMKTLEGDTLTTEDISHKLNIDFEQAQVLAVAPEMLEVLERLLWIADAAWRNAIMAADAPMPAKLAKVEEGSPEAKQARAVIKAAKGDA